jgi:prophage regulatory protein
MFKEEKEAVFFLRRKQVQAITGLSRSSLYLRIANGTFPRQIPLGTGSRAIGWLSSEVDHWVEQQVAQARATSPKSASMPAGHDSGAKDRLSAPNKATAKGSKPSRKPRPQLAPETAARP